jgi:hypothetical protein
MRIFKLAMRLGCFVILTSNTFAQNETASIAGRVFDGSGAVVPGTQVTLIANDGETRKTLANREGRFVFEDVAPGAGYRLRAELVGFLPDEAGDIVLAAGVARNVDLHLEIGCLERETVPPQDFDAFLLADAAVHARVTEADVEQVDDHCGMRRELLVLHAASLLEQAPSAGQRVVLIGGDRLDVGKEYLLLLNHWQTRKYLRVYAPYRRDVKNGHVRGKATSELGIRNGMPVTQTLENLHALYSKSTRYRDYKSVPNENAGLDTLRYQTGWLSAGVASISPARWTERPAFELIGDTSADWVLPHRGDLIRMTSDDNIYVRDFAALGEAFRLRPPAFNPHRPDLRDLTTVAAKSGVAYRIVDLQFERRRGDDTANVWLRIEPEHPRSAKTLP